VFNDIVAKDFKARGYYDDKYWSQVQVSQGLPFVTQTLKSLYWIQAHQDGVERSGEKDNHWHLLFQSGE
jgi:hypothetical protein